MFSDVLEFLHPKGGSDGRRDNENDDPLSFGGWPKSVQLRNHKCLWALEPYIVVLKICHLETEERLKTGMVDR